MSPMRIIVKPNSPKTKILDYDESKQAYRVAIAAPASENKANIEVIKFFSKLSKKKVRITNGRTSKLKTLKFE